MTSEVTERSAVRARVTQASSPSTATIGARAVTAASTASRASRVPERLGSPDPRVAPRPVAEPGGIPVRLGVGHRRPGPVPGWRGPGRAAAEGRGSGLRRGLRRLPGHRAGLLPAGRAGRAAGGDDRRRERRRRRAARAPGRRQRSRRHGVPAARRHRHPLRPRPITGATAGATGGGGGSGSAVVGGTEQALGLRAHPPHLDRLGDRGAVGVALQRGDDLVVVRALARVRRQRRVQQRLDARVDRLEVGVAGAHPGEHGAHRARCRTAGCRSRRRRSSRPSPTSRWPA